MAADDHELRLDRPHRLVFPPTELDCRCAVLVAAFADEVEHSLAPLPGGAADSKALVEKYGSRRADARIRLLIAVVEDTRPWGIGDSGRGFAEGGTAMPGVDAESGRGLAFLDALANRWGVVHNGESCVWFELDL